MHEWRAAQHREHSLHSAAGPLPPEAAWQAALELYELLPVDFRLSDATRVREVDLARRAWRTLRMHLTRA